MTKENEAKWLEEIGEIEKVIKGLYAIKGVLESAEGYLPEQLKAHLKCLEYAKDVLDEKLNHLSEKYETDTKNDLGEATMTRFDAIKQMNIEDLAFFLSIIELGDLNSIPNIANEDINYYISYLKEEDNGLIDALHKSNESRHDYKEQKMGMTIDKAIIQSTIQLSIWELGCESKAYYSPKAIETLIEIAKKYQKIEQIIKAWNDMNSFDSMVQISEVIEDGNNN